MTWFDSGMFNQEVSCDKWMESTKKFTLQMVHKEPWKHITPPENTKVAVNLTFSGALSFALHDIFLQF